MATSILALTMFAFMAAPVAAQSPADSSVADPPDPWGDEGVAPDAVPERPLSGFAILVEQDQFAGQRNEDRNYTMGVGFQFPGSWSNTWARGALQKPRALFDALFGIDRKRTKNALEGRSAGFSFENHSFLFGNTAFTPDSLNTTRPVYGDRPYSSLLFYTVSKAQVLRSGSGEDLDTVLRTEFTFGILGLRISEEVQTWIHGEIRKHNGKEVPYDPLGWPNQVSDGGEPTARFGASYQRLTVNKRYADFSWKGEGNLGYYTNVAAGALTRLGWIDTPFWMFDPAPLVAVNEARETADRMRRGTRGWEAYAFAGGRCRLVAYNAMLQGQFRESVHTLDPSQIERVLFEFETGIRAGYRGWSVTWVTGAGRSPEHRLPEARSHYWGGIFVSYQAGYRRAGGGS
ncbi:MAG TPA: lipid A-modifier LpxR family protein [Candidatus Krumholzibacteria bacterium]|nr:lipid A-modifier LpxR family protein [Candidatus Krumholzibacteria bacterium]